MRRCAVASWPKAAARDADDSHALQYQRQHRISPVKSPTRHHRTNKYQFANGCVTITCNTKPNNHFSNSSYNYEYIIHITRRYRYVLQFTKTKENLVPAQTSRVLRRGVHILCVANTNSRSHEWLGRRKNNISTISKIIRRKMR